MYKINGKIEFSPEKKMLDNGTNSIKLRATAALCLELFLEKQGILIPHKELCEYAWEKFGMTVTNNVLHNTIFYLRKSLTDLGELESTCIESIPRRGFVFSKKIDVIYQNGSIIQDKALENDIEKTANILNDTKENNHTKTREHIENTPLGKPEFDISKNNIKDHNITISKKTKLRLPYYVVSLVFLFFLFVAAGFLLVSNNSFTAEYKFKGHLEDCIVYQNSDGFTFEDIKEIKDMKKNCKTSKFIYLTTYPYTNKISVIKCDEELSMFSDDVCYSSYFLTKESVDKNEH